MSIQNSKDEPERVLTMVRRAFDVKWGETKLWRIGYATTEKA
ncbi:MAG: hypothetical protein SFZ02_12485 [bacterium]|nr:hypothetical protein [bacterium]